MNYEILKINKSSVLIGLFITMTMIACKDVNEEPKEITLEKGFEVYETSRSGNKLTALDTFVKQDTISNIKINPSKTYQEFTGFGGAFTESSAYLLNQMSKANRDKIINAYFGPDGAKYSLQRTHMNSCDFSLDQYSYAPVKDDMTLENFSVAEDTADLIPFIKDAMKASEDGFKIFASPWTAPPWMKTNNDWVGGELDPKYNDTWALFFSKYVDAYNRFFSFLSELDDYYQFKNFFTKLLKNFLRLFKNGCIQGARN